MALARWANVVVLQKPFHPDWFIDTLANLNRNIVVDIDDAVWEPVAGQDIERAAVLGGRLDYIISRARLLVTGSQYLADILQHRNPAIRAHVLPSSVEISQFAIHNHGASGPVVAGWIGSPEHLRDISVCRVPLAKLVKKGDLHLRVVSSDPLGLDDLPSEFVRWSANREPSHVASFDIGIMPLRDTPRSRGRCGFKAIQYMAAGVPVVSSALPGPSDVVEDGVTGFVVDDDEGWRVRLTELARDAELRKRIGAAGRAAVKERYSAASNARRLADLLASVG
jgi:glycosyltransferase involved in cell wall biosynthesis